MNERPYLRSRDTDKSYDNLISFDNLRSFKSFNDNKDIPLTL